MQERISKVAARGTVLFLAFLLFAAGSAELQGQTTPSRTPTETVREFYKALSERRFRDALNISVYKGAIEGLTPAEFDELRPDFENMARGADSIEITGEQISGDSATVFLKIKDDNGQPQPSQAQLIKSGDAWIVGDADGQKVVAKAGKDYFFNLRIQTHEDEAHEMMARIIKAQLTYSSMHGGTYADLPALVEANLLPEDVKSADSTGYRYHVTLSKEGKSFSAGAEPAVYGRTGRVSFYLDPTGLSFKDVGGKPLKPEKK